MIDVLYVNCNFVCMPWRSTYIVMALGVQNKQSSWNNAGKPQPIGTKVGRLRAKTARRLAYMTSRALSTTTTSRLRYYGQSVKLSSWNFQHRSAAVLGSRHCVLCHNPDCSCEDCRKVLL